MIGYEVKIVRESGIVLGRAASWEGWRVRYRKDGTRLWRSFLLTVEGSGRPSDELLERAVLAHAEQVTT